MAPWLDNNAASQELDRRRARLGRREEDLLGVVHRHLLEGLVSFELAKLRRAGLPPEEQSLDAFQVRAALGTVFTLGVDLEALSRAHLLAVGRALGPEPSWRSGPAQVAPGQPALPPQTLELALDHFFEWAGSPSFRQLRPVERFTLAQVRLHEIHPFAQHSACAVSLFSFYFLWCEGVLPPLYLEGELVRFHLGLERAFACSTEDLLSFNLEACLRSYEQALGEGGAPFL